MTLQVRKTAVLGAGVMGAQIAAHLANANVPVVLFDLTAKEGDPSGVTKRAIENLKKLSPPPATTRDRIGYVEPANYDQHLDKLKECDLIIEAIAERMDWKLDYISASRRTSRRMSPLPPIPRACPSRKWARRCRKPYARASAAYISSIRPAT